MPASGSCNAQTPGWPAGKVRPGLTFVLAGAESSEVGSRECAAAARALAGSRTELFVRLSDLTRARSTTKPIRWCPSSSS
jgi:hypothetical protein